MKKWAILGILAMVFAAAVPVLRKIVRFPDSFIPRAIPDAPKEPAKVFSQMTTLRLYMTKRPTMLER